MSLYEVRAFMGRVSEDQVSRARLESRLEAGAGEAQILVEFASELGYDFNVGEFEDVIRGRTETRGQLSDGELDEVAGGGAVDAPSPRGPVFVQDETGAWSLAPRPLRTR